MDEAVRTLAREAGILNDWVDAAGRPQRVSVGSLRSILDALGYPSGSKNDIAQSRARLSKLAGGSRTFYTATAAAPIVVGSTTFPAINEPGYYSRERQGREITIAVAPARCVTFQDVAPDARMYGLAIQLYSLRRDGGSEFGDAGVLAEFATQLAERGADALALSPTHSLFAADPGHYAPYSPSNRLALNAIYADPRAVFGAERVAPEAAASPEPQASLIDWREAIPRKYTQLRHLYEDFSACELTQPGSWPLAADFRAFEREGGAWLREHALFEALHARWIEAGKWDWRDWPASWRGIEGAEVRNFAAREHAEVEYHIFLQWLVDRSFKHAQQVARAAGMRIGLISDLAVGIHPGGSHVWSRPQDLMVGLSIGAPPDLFNERGQDWGLTGFSPQALVASGYQPFIATLRAALRHAGGIRIDHAMGLSRLWLISKGGSPAEGAYLQYPLDDMLRLIALESHRHRAIVIGEDLGTVEPAFRKRIADTGIAGMDVLWFARAGSEFLSPGQWRSDAIAMSSTHDLPTIAGWWTGADIVARHAVGLANAEQEAQERAQDREGLTRAFRNAGIGKDGTPLDEELAVDAAIAFTAQSPAALALIPIEDVLGLKEQPNLPGTIDEHPNWRRRLPETIDQALENHRVKARLETLAER